MAAKEQVTPEKVLAEAGTTGKLGISLKLNPVQRAGLWLAAGVGLIILVVTVYVLIFVYHNYPSQPLPNSTGDATPSIEQYKQLSELVIKNGREIFQTIVTQALLPVLTAILGYIFGKAERGG
jgi:hypothetical protein